MANPSHENDLVDRHYVTLIVRMTVDSRGRLVRGEMVDAMNTFRERFTGADGLMGAVQTWLARHERDGAVRLQSPE